MLDLRTVRLRATQANFYLKLVMRWEIPGGYSPQERLSLPLGLCKIEPGGSYCIFSLTSLFPVHLGIANQHKCVGLHDRAGALGISHPRLRPLHCVHGSYFHVTSDLCSSSVSKSWFLLSPPMPELSLQLKIHPTPPYLSLLCSLASSGLWYRMTRSTTTTID